MKVKLQTHLHPDNCKNIADDCVNPITNFLFALKAPETKRQYPRRLEVFLDFLNMQGSFETRLWLFIIRLLSIQNGCHNN